MTDTKSTALLGALVADAAALGVHWIYDVERIAQVAARSGSAAFVSVDAQNYDGVPAYFAHGLRCDGMQSQYGAVLRLVLESMAQHGGFERDAYAQEFAAFFGAGGRYQGYIDRPTRGALVNIAAEVTPSGVDDDQLPAVAALPAIVARYGGAEQGDKIEQAMQVTNVNSVASQFGAVFAAVLNGVLAGEDLGHVLRAAAHGADGDVRPALIAALETGEADSIAYGEVTGRACHLPMAVPLVFHILSRSASFEEAVERNNRAGGDSCGRAIFIGSIMGAVHGVNQPGGIPLDWILNTDDAKGILRVCQALGFSRIA